jgi:hypothetical protein
MAAWPSRSRSCIDACAIVRSQDIDQVLQGRIASIGHVSDCHLDPQVHALAELTIDHAVARNGFQRRRNQRNTLTVGDQAEEHVVVSRFRDSTGTKAVGAEDSLEVIVDNRLHVEVQHRTCDTRNVS